MWRCPARRRYCQRPLHSHRTCVKPTHECTALCTLRTKYLSSQLLSCMGVTYKHLVGTTLCNLYRIRMNTTLIPCLGHPRSGTGSLRTQQLRPRLQLETALDAMHECRCLTFWDEQQQAPPGASWVGLLLCTCICKQTACQDPKQIYFKLSRPPDSRVMVAYWHSLH